MAVDRWTSRLPDGGVAAFCDARLPQCYWGEIGVAEGASVARMHCEWDAFAVANPTLARPVFPIGETYSKIRVVTAAEVESFIKTEPGASLYTLEAATSDVLAMLKARAASLVQMPPPQVRWPDGPASPLRVQTDDQGLPAPTTPDDAEAT